MTSVPAAVLRGEAEARGLLGWVGVSIGWLAVSCAFWRFVLRFYTSASS